ncbi:nose resistant to fluoxetine protein 6-like [Clytia hemisphaerica]|uniref:Nose resistant-to-fluoxetine protein N-terminal domain-containing protein n=1 Tax=Clytia hemisphaerica TaxID=252671 RepID=A0A7M5WVE4_9CNID
MEKAKYIFCVILALHIRVIDGQYFTHDFNVTNDGLEKVFLNLNVSKGCMKSLLGLLADETKAIKYIDASGKPGPGILQGNIWWMGSYDECISIEEAHFCSMTNVQLSFGKTKTKLRVYGLCIPKTCDVKDGTNILKFLAQEVDSKVGTNILNITETYGDFGSRPSKCHSKSKSYSTGAIVMLWMSGLIAGLCLIGTLVDVIQSIYQSFRDWVPQYDDDVMHNKKYILEDEYLKYDRPSSPAADTQISDKVKNDLKAISIRNVQIDKEQPFYIRFLQCFSMVRNSRALCNTSVPKGAITCLNGIRTISITWIIMGHYVIYFSEMSPTGNVLAMTKRYTERWTFQVPLNGGIAVDTFFLLSGTLVGYLSMKRFDIHGSLPLIRYYFHRYIRLTPSYAYLIFFYAFLFPVLSEGPYWGFENVGLCRKYWWTNLLYINNFYPTNILDMCINWGWYLANDMQFYVVSPLFLYCMYKCRWKGITYMSIAVLSMHVISNGVLMYEENAISPLFYEKDSTFGKVSVLFNYQNYVYDKPYCRFIVYFIGLVLGYTLFNEVKINPKWRKTAHVIGWCISVPIALSLVYGPYTSTKHSWSVAENESYGILFRMTWALVLSWVIYACHNNHGGYINDFLSWKLFLPLSRLTYSVYLWHNIVMMLLFQSFQSAIIVTDQIMALVYVAVTIFSFMVAYIIAVCIEYPVLNLEKLLLKF